LGAVEVIPADADFDTPATLTFPIPKSLPAGQAIPILMVDRIRRTVVRTPYIAVVDPSGRAAVGKVGHGGVFALEYSADPYHPPPPLDPNHGPVGTVIPVDFLFATEPDLEITFAGPDNTAIPATIFTEGTERHFAVPEGARTGNVIVGRKDRSFSSS